MSRLSFKLLAVAALAFATPAMAADDGDLADTSTGTSVITVTIPQQVQITGVGDITFGELTVTDMNDGATRFDNVCVFSNAGASKGYTVAGSGSGTASAFTVTDGTTAVPYTVTFNNAAGGAGEDLTAAGTAVAFTGGGAVDEACASPNASFDISFAATALQAAPAGAYTGTLTLLVSPDEGV